MESKKGAGGQDIKLTANYFPLVTKNPGWRLLHYHVDMNPMMDETRQRKKLLAQHKASLPKFIFDGSALFTTTRLGPEEKPFIINAKRDSDGVVVVISMKLVREVQPTDYAYMQFFNIVLRQAMGQLQLEEMRRNYFDPKVTHDTTTLYRQFLISNLQI